MEGKIIHPLLKKSLLPPNLINILPTFEKYCLPFSCRYPKNQQQSGNFVLFVSPPPPILQPFQQKLNGSNGLTKSKCRVVSDVCSMSVLMLSTSFSMLNMDKYWWPIIVLSVRMLYNADHVFLPFALEYGIMLCIWCQNVRMIDQLQHWVPKISI